MFRPKKKKELSLLDELKALEMLEEGEMVDIPEIENDDLIEENSLRVVVRCLNPAAHKVGGLVKALPPIWGLEDRVHERGVGENRVQFIFQSDRDLHHVLTRGPWFVNGWIVSVNQWTPRPGPDFLKKIPFWIRVRGIPIHLLKKQAIESLLGPLGTVEKVELHAKNSTSIYYVRALVWINADEPLQFRRTARFRSGEVVPTELEYEKLLKICFTCKSLTHEQSRCPEVAPAQSLPVSRGHRSKNALIATRECRKEAPPEPSSGHRLTITKGSLSQIPLARQAKSTEHRKRDDKKGKRSETAPSQVWKKKSIAIGGNSKSTEESSQHSSQRVCFSGEGRNSSGASEETVSVFERLSSKFDTPSKDTESSDKNQDGRSSKGSRSPPSVFETLGFPPISSSDKKNKDAELSTAKRRRSGSNSGGRESKKVRLSGRESNISPSSVFHRLGSQVVVPEGNHSGDKKHSAHVAAYTQSLYVQRIVLASGKIVEEGLMVNTNPSSPI
ncbi:PREDICTED: uncharacterized protein LOC106323845 [Brassica oleracea var. oleracea]|uniref:uncharacterized protein LOC106323845 n=1 Tax=Brassica oleracea var. oleracea TaxID=109376 RepID=UPI0006A73732|nr:PREDICTED: uncharacterized protein LOC106323845 [Brassica oleracea var. oleracea]